MHRIRRGDNEHFWKRRCPPASSCFLSSVSCPLDALYSRQILTTTPSGR